MRCSVFALLVGIIGSMQAAEALKLLILTGTSLNGWLLLLNALQMEWRTRKAPEAGSGVRRWRGQAR